MKKESIKNFLSKLKSFFSKKSVIITTIAILLAAIALTCVLIFVLRDNGDNGENNPQGNLPSGPTVPIDTRDDYRVRFVYSYTAKIVNSNSRTEYVKAVKTVDSIYIPRDSGVFNAEALAKVDELKYHGFTFDKWYAEWDMENQVGVEGTEYDFSAAVIADDIIIYGSRGESRDVWLAGPTATYELVEVYEDGTTSKMSDGSGGGESSEEEEPVKVIKDVVLYINGSGAMFDFSYPNEIDVPWHNRAGEITKVVVEDGITTIGANSFGNLTKLKAIELPDTITVIGDSAFAGCTHAGFRKLVCPTSLVSIERNAFNNTAIKEVVLNDGLRYIKDNAFYRSNKISTIVIPTSLESVGNAAFHPGAVGSNNNTHKLSKVYYKGFEKSAWENINVSMDNSWLVDMPTIYYYTADETIGNDTTAPVPYWHYAEVNGVLTDVPAQYCYSLKYFLPQGSKLPFKEIYVPAQEKVVNGQLQYTDEGILILEGVITREIVAQQNSITYNGYRFASFTGTDPIHEGMIINDDRKYTGVRGDILSEDGGIRWSIEDNVVTVYKDENTEDRIKAEIYADYESKLMEQEKAAIIAAVTAQLETEIRASGKPMTPAAKEAEINRRLELELPKASAKVDAKIESAEVKAAMQADLDARLAVAFKMWDFETIIDTGNLWNGATTALKNIRALIIEDGVEYIGKFAFNSLSSVTEVVIPKSVKEIHRTAFAGCSSLYAVLYTGEIKNESGAENCVGLSNLATPGVVSTKTKVYEYVESATAEAGTFWTIITVETPNETIEKKLTWDFDGSKIIVGGADDLPGFASPEAAPWYGAKDKITSVEFVNNITSLGENLFNGYTNLVALKLPVNLRVIPASTFDNTGIVNNTAAYENGVLLINGHLLRVDASKVTGSMYKTFYGVITIAGGAFKGINISELVVATSVQYINVDAFPDANITRIYSENPKSSWIAAAVDTGFNNDLDKDGNVDIVVEVYYYSASEPAVGSTDRFYRVENGQYIVWDVAE